MKTKIIETDYGLYYVLVKFNWYTKWEVVNYDGHQFKIHNSINEAWKDWSVDLIISYQEAVKILEKYKIYYEKSRYTNRRCFNLLYIIS